MKLTVIILNYNTAETTARAIKTFREAEPSLNAQFILIDNGSTTPMEWPADDSKVIFLRNPENRGFAAAVNQGLKLADTEYILLLNSDVFIKPGSISALLDYLYSNSRVGLVGPRLIFPDGRFQPSCGRFPNWQRELFRFLRLGTILPFDTIIYQTVFNRSFFKQPQIVDWVSGACLLIRREVIEKVGLLDERFFFGAEDFDYCWRAREAGFLSAYYPDALAIHYHAHSSGGHRSETSFNFEKQGILTFLEKNLGKKKGLRVLVASLYALKAKARKIIKS